jgi:hypothetical protein
MKKLLIIFLFLYGFSCNPYRPYYFTHYHINASYDPATTRLSANVQLVFVPQQEYHDSITFQLNEFVEIQSLTAQELKYYEFECGRLVLYIEGAVMPGDQLHISLTFKGMIGDGSDPGAMLTPDRLWYPVNPDIDKLTYSIELELPEQYSLEEPGIQKGQSWHWDTKKPLGSIAVPHWME